MIFSAAIKKALLNLKSKEFRERVILEDETMLNHLINIQTINKKGFITDSSQGGRKTSGIRQDGKKYIMCERAYITGFMLEKKAEKFIKNINLETDKNAIHIPYCCNNIYLPPILDIPLTTTKIPSNEIKIVTHMSSTIPKKKWDSLRKQLGINKSEKIVYIFCWDTKWNRNASNKNGLFTNIIKQL